MARPHRLDRQAHGPEHRVDARRRPAWAGAAEGHHAARAAATRQADRHGSDPSPFYEAFRKMPDSIPAAEQARLQAAARDAITKTVVPSYTKLKRYVVNEYLPQPANRGPVGHAERRGPLR